MTTFSLILLGALFISCLANIYQLLQYEKLSELYDYEYENNQRLLNDVELLNKRFSTISGKTAALELAKQKQSKKSDEDNINQRWP